MSEHFMTLRSKGLNNGRFYGNGKNILVTGKI